MVRKKYDIASLHKQLLKKIPIDCIGIYVLMDYLGCILYVGQSWDSIRRRISYHFNRSDILAKHQIDPGEIAYVEIWALGTNADKNINAFTFKSLEQYVFNKYNSQFPLVNSVILKPLTCILTDLPAPQIFQILPDEVIVDRSQPHIWKRAKKAQIKRMMWYMSICSDDNYNLKRSFRAIKKRYKEILRMERDLLKSSFVPVDIDNVISI